MQCFDNYNPVVVTVYFLFVTTIVMFSMNPILVVMSFVGAVSYFILKNYGTERNRHRGTIGLFCIMALMNPLFSHNGVTVLFVMNHNPITLEAVLYGIVAAGMIITVLYWFQMFSQIMTSDKLLYLFGKFSPKLALVLSMGLRYVELFRRQAKKVQQSQIALGLYKEDNVIDTFRGKIRIFSILLTWGLENGIITADSMAARGYGSGTRSRLENFRFSRKDRIALGMTLILGFFTLGIMGMGVMDISYYPMFQYSEFTKLSCFGYLSYGFLVLMPGVVELEEQIKWKYLKSKV